VAPNLVNVVFNDAAANTVNVPGAAGKTCPDDAAAPEVAPAAPVPLAADVGADDLGAEDTADAVDKAAGVVAALAEEEEPLPAALLAEPQPASNAAAARAATTQPA